MEKKKLIQYMTLSLVLSMSVGCSGSSSKSVKSSSDGDMVEGGGGASASAVEKVVADTGDVGGSVATTVRTLGATISQVDLLGTGEITSGTGEIITNVADGVSSLSTGLKDGLGSLSDNDNAIGTTLAGATGTVAETGEAVAAAGNTIESINTLPVFAQLDDATGLLTELGGTIGSLGAIVTETGETLSVSFEEGALSATTTQLTAVVRPLVTNIDGKTQTIGDALVVGPVGSNLLSELGTAVVVLGNDISDDENAVLAGVGGTVVGAGQLVIDAGGVLSVAEPGQGGIGDVFDLAGLVDTNELPVVGSDEGGLLDGGTDGVVATVTDTVDGLTGGNGGLLDGGTDGLVGSVTGSVDGLTGGDEGLIAGVTGGLLDSGDNDNGLVDRVDDAVLDPILGGIL